MARVKHSHLAGRWYPDDAGHLRAQVDTWLQDATPHPGCRGRWIGVVVPHAGYQYSGRTAAAGYAGLVGGAYRRAVILAPSHYAAFRGVALLDVDAFASPLGSVTVDREALAALAAAPLCAERPDAYQEEHSLEIQVPLLQCALPQVSVVPVLIGHLEGADYATVARALAPLATDDTVFIVSSDFVHYGRRFGYLPVPPEGATQVAAAVRRLDMGAIERVCAGDAAGFVQYVADTGATICGRMPITVFLTLQRQRPAGRLLTYCTSLDMTGDYEHCVSYASIAFPADLKFETPHPKLETNSATRKSE